MSNRFYPLLLLTVVSCTLHADSRIVLLSSPGDYTGRGNHYLYTSENAHIKYSRYQDHGITVDIDNLPGHSPDWWTLDITSPDNTQIKPGLYKNAVRIPFQTPGQPGLLFSGNGRYCTAINGWYEVYSVKYGETGDLESLDMQFEQRCVGYTASIRGEIRFNISADVDNYIEIH
jgi:hypothetical protein